MKRAVKGNSPQPGVNINAAIIAALVVSILFIYAQTFGFDYINYDDDVYILLNSKVRAGLTLEGIGYAFTAIDERTHFQPLTWISFMLDCELFGVKPGPQHAVNVLLFLLLCWILFRFWSEATGNVERSAAAVLLFAVHPLRVESVAWIAERKDVLSGLFVALTLLSYARYVKAPRRGLYLWTLGWFALALLAKPAAVTVPVLLLLLDYWPLRRPIAAGRLLYEKVPFAILSSLSVFVTLIGAIKLASTEMVNVPLLTRIQKAPEFLWTYLVLTFRPVNLAVLYPYDTNTSLWILFAIGIAGITAVCVFLRKNHPYLLFGWLWFAISISPNLGLVQSGVQSTADRFTFLGHMGLFAALVWGASERLPERAKRIALASILLVLTGISYARTSYWKDSVTLLESAVQSTPPNWMASLKLGTAYEDRGNFEQAERNLREAAKIRPSDFHATYHLGKVLAATKRPAEAAEWFTRTVALKPDYAEAHYSLGVMNASTSRFHEARLDLEKSVALNLEPKYRAEAFNLIGTTHAREGRFQEALRAFEQALQVDPTMAGVHANKARALAALNRREEAVAYVRGLQGFGGNAELRRVAQELGIIP